MFRRLFSRSNRPQHRARPFEAKLAVEELEARRVLSADIAALIADAAAEVGPPMTAIEKVDLAQGHVDEALVNNPNEHTLNGLLLPAVQKVREAASHSDPPSTDPPAPDISPALANTETAQEHVDEALVNNPNEHPLNGLLLPAVQKVREAASHSDPPSTDPPAPDISPALANTETAQEHVDEALVNNPNEHPLIGLLLPAVQKVR